MITMDLGQLLTAIFGVLGIVGGACFFGYRIFDWFNKKSKQIIATLDFKLTNQGTLIQQMQNYIGNLEGDVLHLKLDNAKQQVTLANTVADFEIRARQSDLQMQALLLQLGEIGTGVERVVTELEELKIHLNGNASILSDMEEAVQALKAITARRRTGQTDKLLGKAGN